MERKYFFINKRKVRRKKKNSKNNLLYHSCRSYSIGLSWFMFVSQTWLFSIIIIIMMRIKFSNENQPVFSAKQKKNSRYRERGKKLMLKCATIYFGFCSTKFSIFFFVRKFFHIFPLLIISIFFDKLMIYIWIFQYWKL